MPVGRYVTYKCKKCGYKFTKFQGDVFYPVVCPKCGGEVEMVKISLVEDYLKKMFNNF